MLPLQQAYEVRSAVLEYIKATFHFRDAEVGKAFYRFIEDERDGLFKGPYVSLKTPFVKAAGEGEIPLDIRPGFTPHKHQEEAFRRLTTRGGHKPQPTLLTTGTGSGKTECFLYPVLDYVFQMNRHGARKGVKVIIMYPMNALASDQAKRLAEAIWGTEESHPLRDKVSAGLFIGEGVDRTDYPAAMGPHNIIENRDAILDSVPDILLTNFKMLDYGLMQQRYMPLWKGNMGEREPMLRFMVLDELHTYDGAQGTDVANLIRRLKLKLSLPAGWLAPVGTSATIGNGSDSKRLLCEYATDIFGEQFGEDSVIEEHRMTVDDFCGPEGLEPHTPPERLLEGLSADATATVAEYVGKAREAWLSGCPDDKIEIGKRLRRLLIVHDLLDTTSGGTLPLADVKRELGRKNAGYGRLLAERPDLAQAAVESLLALICEAKLPDDTGAARFPLLHLQVQLWQRELSGIMRMVGAEPEFTWRDSIPHDKRTALPIYFCRDCGASGWLTTKKETEQKFGTDAARVNKAFMDNEKEVRLLNTLTESHAPIESYAGGGWATVETPYIRPEDMTICPKADNDTLHVYAISRKKLTAGNKATLDRRCPLCMSDSLAIVGGRTSTLSSVAVSQIMSSDFDSPDGSRRKMLTFCNSVQDAAHLAGFYEVRTFRFLFRQSIQYYLKTLSGPVSLRELQDGFKEFWKKRLEGEEYYHRFMPDDLMEKFDWRSSYREREGGPLSQKFKAEFDLRVDWEICSEFGFMSQRGRTLEKMGSSATFFREEDLRDVFRRMEPWLQENNLEAVAEHEGDFLRLVNGVLHRLRWRGGIDHEFLRLYRTEQLKPVMLNWPRREGVHFLHKRFGKNRIPRVMGFTPVSRGDETLDVTTSKNGHANWFHTYFAKSLYDPSVTVFAPNYDIINDFYKVLMETMAESGILDRQEANGITNYAISPEAIYVGHGVRSFKCGKCESRMHVAKSDTLTPGTHCLDYKCNDGHYDVEEQEQDNYYKRVYSREVSPRIYAHEHTGLLERGKREDIEREFKEGKDRYGRAVAQPTNVLTATSTLEMGIDIGDLNVVANAGIPPKPSNFLQRVGRAGRKEGAALVLNYAKAGKHDMYYFAEPLSMMDGAVGTPGCFLEAKDILRRHFYAFCIDSWASANAGNVIPSRLEFLGLSFNLLNDGTFFANRINQYINGHLAELEENFSKQYPGQGTQSVLSELFKSVEDGTMGRQVIEEFRQMLNRVDKIRREQKELRERLDQIPQNDTERRNDILDQNRGLRALERAIKEESVVEFMTDAGLLPNYAFPETGVKLSATIFSRKAPGDDAENTPAPQSLELVRPASQGIRELAPGNVFYTQKLGLEIKGMNLTDRTDSVKQMRYCSKCDALADEGDQEWYASRCCPKCGSDSWHSNQHKYLKFTTATTSVCRNDAALDDSHEDRDQKFFHTMRHFRFAQNGDAVAYCLKKAEFGIEFCKDVTLTEVNYGNMEQMAEPVKVNGTEHISGLGFVTCKYCGKSTSVIYGSKEGKEMHYPFCNHKDVGFPADEAHKDTFERLYLYRSVKTEAIKVLLPVQLFDVEDTVELFRAGLELGLRHYYKSSPEHLRIDAYAEFNRDSHNFDNYLIIHDAIPGGTGYLSKLLQPDEHSQPKEFSALLRICYERIRDCKCRQEGKDGCYHCILSYGNQWQRQNLSRRRAEELFKSIVDECFDWEKTNGLGSVSLTGKTEDSELELLFVRAMERVARERHWRWERIDDAVSRQHRYSLMIKDEDVEVKYCVIPQYSLGPAQGVASVTKPDFQFNCAYANVGGEELDPARVAQWSVYLDGYAYHASASHNGFANDMARREAIRQCNIPLRLTWTLTWADIKPYAQPDGAESFADGLYVANPNPNILQGFENELWRRRNSLERFLFMLTRPDIETQRKEAFSYVASCWTECQDYIAPYDKIDDAVRENARSQYKSSISDADHDALHFFIKTTFIPRNSLVTGCAWYPYDQEDGFGDGIRYDWAMRKIPQELNREDWEDFWRRYDILQFFRQPFPAPSVELDDILPYFPGLEDVVSTLFNNNVPFTTEGSYSLMENGKIVAEAAIKIEGKDIVIDNFEERADAVAKFKAHGFTVLTPETFDINKVK